MQIWQNSAVEATDDSLIEPAATQFAAAQQAAATGQLLVVPTETVYGIGVSIHAPDGVKRLLAAKGRGRQMPPPVVAASLHDLEPLIAPLQAHQKVLLKKFWPGPLTIILPVNPTSALDLGDLAGTIAVRIPRQNQLLELLAVTGPLALTSANLTGKPPATTVAAAREYFGDRVGAYIDGGESELGAASTILDLSQSQPRILREGPYKASDLAEFFEGGW